MSKQLFIMSDPARVYDFGFEIRENDVVQLDNIFVKIKNIVELADKLQGDLVRATNLEFLEFKSMQKEHI